MPDQSPATIAAEPSLAAAILDRLQPAPYWDHVGCRMVSVAPGRVTVRLPARSAHGRSSNTGDGTLHGGMVATLIDMAASCAVISVIDRNHGRTTIDLSVHYLAPARGDLEAAATVRRRGGRTAIVDIEVTDEAQVLVALGRATFALLPPRRS